MVMVDVVS